MNVNPACQAGELRYALDKVRVKALVVAKAFRKTNLMDILGQIVPQLDASRTAYQQELVNYPLVSSSRVPSLRRVIVMSNQLQNR